MDSDDQFNTLIRIAGSWSSFGAAFAAIMETYGWKHLMIVSDTAVGQCLDAASAINDRLTSTSADVNNFTVYWIRMVQSPSAKDIDDALRQIPLRARGWEKSFKAYSFQQILYNS
jgi:exoribonuclease R